MSSIYNITEFYGLKLPKLRQRLPFTGDSLKRVLTFNGIIKYSIKSENEIPHHSDINPSCLEGKVPLKQTMKLTN